MHVDYNRRAPPRNGNEKKIFFVDTVIITPKSATVNGYDKYIWIKKYITGKSSMNLKKTRTEKKIKWNTRPFALNWSIRGTFSFTCMYVNSVFKLNVGHDFEYIVSEIQRVFLIYSAFYGCFV
jgi:hypothetical protein